MDEIMCCMQSSSEKAAIVGFRPLPMWVGVAECRGGARETYRVSRGNEKVCLRVNIASYRQIVFRLGSLFSVLLPSPSTPPIAEKINSPTLSSRY